MTFHFSNKHVWTLVFGSLLLSQRNNNAEAGSSHRGVVEFLFHENITKATNEELNMIVEYFLESYNKANNEESGLDDPHERRMSNATILHIGNTIYSDYKGDVYNTSEYVPDDGVTTTRGRLSHRRYLGEDYGFNLVPFFYNTYAYSVTDMVLLIDGTCRHDCPDDEVRMFHGVNALFQQPYRRTLC
jgi:hypothetical protein